MRQTESESVKPLGMAMTGQQTYPQRMLESVVISYSGFHMSVFNKFVHKFKPYRKLSLFVISLISFSSVNGSLWKS